MPLAAEGEFALSRAQLELGLGKWLSARLDRVSTPGGDHDLLAGLAEVAAQQADVDALSRYAPLAAAAAARVGHRPYAALAARARGVAERLAGRLPAAEAALQEALAAFIALDMPWQAARTHAELGALAEAAAQPAAARGHYAQALAACQALGAVPLAEQLTQRLSGL